MTAGTSGRAARIAGLYAITPDLDDTDLLVSLVGAAVDGGATVVQYRNKGADAARALEQARRVAVAVATYGVPLIVNDHADIALAIHGAGLHVGADDVGDVDALHRLRERLGPSRILGVSCYRSLERARDAVAAGADYVAFGSVFPSSTKPAAPAAALGVFDEARALGVPLVGIGGITRDNVASLIDAGCDAAAVIADLFESRDPATVASRARAFTRVFETRAVPPTTASPR